MDTIKTTKKIIMDVQGVLNEAVDKLDLIEQYGAETVSVDTAIAAVHTCAKGYEQFMDNLTIEACCHILLKKYQGHEPSLGDVLTFKTAIELMLHNDYGVSTSKFE